LVSAGSAAILILVENMVDMLLADQRPSDGALHCLAGPT
jgi:hypothetical protein